jgi:hypothetical protein
MDVLRNMSQNNGSACRLALVLRYSKVLFLSFYFKLKISSNHCIGDGNDGKTVLHILQIRLWK